MKVRIIQILLRSEFEPHHDKTNKITFAPIKDSDQSGHQPSLISAFAVCSMSILHADSEGSDQTGRMPRLI